jgi:hypothetical protein
MMPVRGHAGQPENGSREFGNTGLQSKRTDSYEMEPQVDSGHRVLGSVFRITRLAERYPWLDTIWYAAWMLFLLVVGVYAVTQIFRMRKDTDGYVGYRGVPRWAVRLFGDDVEPRKPTAKSEVP